MLEQRWQSGATAVCNAVSGKNYGRTLSIAVAAFLTVTGALPCQVPPDGWVTGDTYHNVVVHDAVWRVLASQVGSNLNGGLTVDDRGDIFSAGGQWVWKLHYDPTQNPPLNRTGVPIILSVVAPARPIVVAHLAAARDRLWFLTSAGDLGYLDKVTAGQTPNFAGNVLEATGIWAGVTDMCSDGREAFFSIHVSGNDPFHLFAVDLMSSPLSVRPLASFPSQATVRLGPSLVLARDGNLLAMDQDFLYLVDTRTGAKTLVEPRPSDPDFTPGRGQPRQIEVAYDPWSDVVAVSPTWMTSTTNIYTRILANGAFAPAYYNPFFAGLGKMASTSEQPFELFGKGCANGLAEEPRLGWQGLPLQGTTFALKLRQAEPNGLAMFWLGFSDTFWAPFGTLPFSGGSIGAPGCQLLVSGDSPYPVFVDATGRASLNVSVPINPAIHGWEVYAQTASASGGNTFGFATSGAIAIRLR